MRLLSQIRVLQDFGFELEETRPFVDCLRAGHPAGGACPASPAVYRRKVVQIGADSNPAAVTRYGVLSLPTLLLFRDGEPVRQIVGARAKRRLLQEVEEGLAAAARA
ncbi:thioredoxin domain-containing protein [Streptomyces sp. NPDC090045]|uniref:thioredoxin domain-containing protein n=1 Tax=Streptomyces sp. NPDC090045 TaxID=3365927 RepID=UPI0038063C0E